MKRKIADLSEFGNPNSTASFAVSENSLIYVVILETEQRIRLALAL